MIYVYCIINYIVILCKNKIYKYRNKNEQRKTNADTEQYRIFMLSDNS